MGVMYDVWDAAMDEKRRTNQFGAFFLLRTQFRSSYSQLSKRPSSDRSYCETMIVDIEAKDFEQIADHICAYEEDFTKQVSRQLGINTRVEMF